MSQASSCSATTSTAATAFSGRLEFNLLLCTIRCVYLGVLSRLTAVQRDFRVYNEDESAFGRSLWGYYVARLSDSLGGFIVLKGN